MTHFIRTHRFDPSLVFLAVLGAAVFAVTLAHVLGIHSALLPVVGAPFMFIGMASDSNQIYRNGASAGNLTSDPYDDGPFPINGLPLRLTVPLSNGSETLTVNVLECATSNGSFTLCGTPFTILGATAASVYYGRVNSRLRYHEYNFDVTGSPNFGAVDLRAITGAEYDLAPVAYDA